MTPFIRTLFLKKITRIALVILLGIVLVYLYREREKTMEPDYPVPQIRLKPNTEILSSYEKFRAYCEENFEISDMLFINYNLPLYENFQVIFQNPDLYLPLVKQLMADENVKYYVKNGTASTMLGLQIDRLAEFVDYLNQLSFKDPKILQHAIDITGNPYMDADEVRHFKPNFAYYRLDDYARRPKVKKAYINMYNNPYLNQKDKEEGGWLYKLVYK